MKLTIDTFCVIKLWINVFNRKFKWTINIAIIMSINLQVNMPLLRLLNQITNMYQNVKDTQTELREQQPHQYVSRNNAKPPTSQSGKLTYFYFIQLIFKT